LSAAFDAIREEAHGVIDRWRFLCFQYGDRYGKRDRPGLIGDRATFYLRTYGMEVTRNHAFCPRTAALLSELPGVSTLAFYLLAPRSHLLPHKGATTALLRGHMGLICPPGCSLIVGEESREWSEHGFIVFDDTHVHEARNDSDELRCILLFDFFRPEHRPESWHALEQGLRAKYLGPRDYLWLLAAETRADTEMMERMRAEAPSARGYDGLSDDDRRALVAMSGLYFT
jgi:hypothetical protein